MKFNIKVSGELLYNYYSGIKPDKGEYISIDDRVFTVLVVTSVAKEESDLMEGYLAYEVNEIDLLCREVKMADFT